MFLLLLFFFFLFLLILRTKLLNVRDRGALTFDQREALPAGLSTRSDSGRINLEWH